MTDHDTRLRRLFAENAAALPGEEFVAHVRSSITARRRGLRLAMLAAWVATIVAFALLLAPSIEQVASAGYSLAQWPERFLETLATRADALTDAVIPSYIYWMLASCALPLIVVGWILRRSRRMF